MKKFLYATTAVFLLSSCEPQAQRSTFQNAVKVEANQQRLESVQPAPQLDVSIERKNLIERLRRLNTENMTGYIYLISHGTVIAEYATRGKPTSLQSYLMAAEAVIRDPNSNTNTASSLLVEQPDYDGAFGENVSGIFFFTAESNAYVEWKGDYVFTDQPMSLNSKPMMVRGVK